MFTVGRAIFQTCALDLSFGTWFACNESQHTVPPIVSRFLSMIRHLLSAVLIGSVVATGTPDVIAQPITAQWVRLPDVAFLPNGPGPRGWSNLFWDSTAQRVAIFGGSAGGGYKNDIWHFNTSTGTWTAVEQPALDCPGYLGFTAPDGRDAHTTAFDPVNNGYWSVAGSGYKCSAGGESLPARTTGAGTTTTSIIDPTLTATTVDFYKHWSVVVQNYYVATITAYDPQTKRLTLATPIASLAAGQPYKIQVWTDGQSWFYEKGTRQWSSLEGSYWGAIRPSPVVAPPQRHTPGFALSTAANKLVFFGGGKNGNGTNDTWVLDPVTKRWTQMKPDSAAGFPYKAMELTSNFVYDSVNDVFIMFGGRCGESRCTTGQSLAETWAYKLSTNTWTRMTPPVSPPARQSGAMYFDSRIGKTVLFAGATVDIYNVVPNNSTLLNDLWVYDFPTNTWTQLNPPLMPAKRYLQMMTFDPVAQKGVMYSGVYPGSSGAEMWTLELTQPVSNVPPVAVATVSPNSGTTATTFSFSGAGSSDSDGSIASYSWNFGDGSPAGTGATPTRQYASPGTYQVQLTVTDNLGASHSATVSVTVSAAPVNQPPTAVATVNPSSGTTATTFAFSGASSTDPEGPISSYSWDFGDGTSGTGVSVNKQYTTTGTFNVQLTVRDAANAAGTVVIPVTVTGQAQPTSLTHRRVISGSITNGSITNVTVAGNPVPFTTSGADYSATITSETAGNVGVTIHYSGPGGTGSQVITVMLP